MWYQCKALELAVTFLLQPPPDQEMFCSRQQRLAQERVAKLQRPEVEIRVSRLIGIDARDVAEAEGKDREAD